jgi:addiction module RelE/StbE family toxin
MVTINWTDQAIADLTNIAEFIRKDSEKYARHTILKIRERVKQLKKYPNSGRRVPESDQSDIRELIFGHYRIIYKVFVTNRIDIIAVHHAARDLKL